MMYDRIKEMKSGERQVLKKTEEDRERLQDLQILLEKKNSLQWLWRQVAGILITAFVFGLLFILVNFFSDDPYDYYLDAGIAAEKILLCVWVAAIPFMCGLLVGRVLWYFISAKGAFVRYRRKRNIRSVPEEIQELQEKINAEEKNGKNKREVLPHTGIRKCPVVFVVSFTVGILLAVVNFVIMYRLN